MSDLYKIKKEASDEFGPVINSSEYLSQIPFTLIAFESSNANTNLDGGGNRSNQSGQNLKKAVGLLRNYYKDNLA